MKPTLVAMLKLVAALTFVGFCVGPLLSLAVFGYPASAQQKPTLGTIDWKGMFASAHSTRTQTVRIVATNSPLGQLAIGWRGWLDYRVLGFVHRSHVVSGRDGWLFYDQDWRDGSCMNPREMLRGVNRAESLRLVAEGAGIDLVLSVLPDKSVVYPEMLGPNARAMLGCSLQNAAAWRRLAADRQSHILDVLAALRSYPSAQPLYLAHDTHWNDLGAILGLRQLIQHYYNIDIGVPLGTDGAQIERRPEDLLKLIGIEQSDDSPSYTAWWKSHGLPLIKSPLKNVLVLHDSFYLTLKPYLRDIFSDPRLYYQFEPTELASVLAPLPSHVLISTVERFAFDRLGNGALSWSGPFPKSLLARNEELAKSCTFSQSPPQMALQRLESSGGNTFRAGADPQIVIRLRANAGRPCVRVRFTSPSSSPSEFYFPTSSGGFEVGLAATFLDRATAGPREIAMVFPPEMAGKVVRFDPIDEAGEIEGLEVEEGSLEP